MASDFRRKQVFILAMAIPAFLVVAAVLFCARSLFGFVTLPGDEPAARIAFVAQCLFLPGCMLWIGVQAAGRRWAYAGAIDGTRFPENRGLEINLRYNLNTLEQFVLAAIAWTNLALTLVVKAWSCFRRWRFFSLLDASRSGSDTCGVRRPARSA